MTYKNRIVGHGEEDPGQLAANPRNWRIHPHQQENALAGVLREVGWVGSILVNQRTGFVVDGHLRVAHAISQNEPTVPVTYVDLSEEEEGLVLAALDPITGLAVTDTSQLKALLSEIHTDDAALEKLLADLAASAPHINNASEILDLLPNERLLVFEQGVQRQIMLLFNAEEYPAVIWQLGQVMTKHPTLETNVDVVKYLLTQEVGVAGSQ